MYSSLGILPPPPLPLPGSLTHSLNGEVKGQHRCQCGRGLAQQVDNPHAACTRRGLVDGDVVVSFLGGDPHGFPYPLPSNAQSPNPRGTHGQSRPELCPCPPGSPAGQSLEVPLQAEKGDTAWLSRQRHCGPERRRALATSTCHSHNSRAGPGCLISLHSWGAEAQRGKVTLLQAHREWE